jgi:hypothetical protein
VPRRGLLVFVVIIALSAGGLVYHEDYAVGISNNSVYHPLTVGQILKNCLPPSNCDSAYAGKRVDVGGVVIGTVSDLGMCASRIGSCYADLGSGNGTLLLSFNANTDCNPIAN